MAVKCILTGQTPSVLDGVTENVQTQIDAKAADNTVVHLAENETISGAKTFTGKVIMNSNDNVGIGTTTPSEKLEVNGTVKATKFKGNGSELTNIPYPVTKVAGKTGAVTLAKGDVGLGNVDNTSDANKPISNATQAALNDKQSKITVNGFLKGDGTGGITADKPIFYVTITGTVESPTADKTPAEIYQAYENGYAVYANVTLTGSSSSTNLKGLLPLAYVLAGTDAQYAITFSSISGKEIKEVRYSPAIRKWEVPYSGVIATKDDLSFTPESIGAQPKITAKGLLKGNGNGVVAAADETEVSLVSLTVDMVDGAVGFTEDIQQTVATTINADTLGGNAPAYYATKASVDTLTTTVNANQTAVETVQSDIQGKLDKTGGTMVGKLIAQSNTDYAVAQVRNVFISTGDPIGGNNGDIWLKYEV